VAILYAILILGGLAVLLGVGLAVASIKFAVEVDPRVEAIEEALPGANCGACGYAGCTGYAEAIVKDNAAVNLCIPGSGSVAAAIAEIMGVKAEDVAALVAKVRCRGDYETSEVKYEYDGVMDCRAAVIIHGGPKSCIYGCRTLGTCANVCPFGAIDHAGPGHIPEINFDRCTACGQCVEACPLGIIALVPEKNSVHVLCVSHDKGKAVKTVCKVGCIGCGACEKVCPFDAIHVVDNLAVIDYEKCTQCGLCTAKCPTKCIEGEPRAERAYIDENCIGCGVCAKHCVVEAISGEKKQRHVVDVEKCIGCGVCVEKCPPKIHAVSLVKPDEMAAVAESQTAGAEDDSA